MPVPSSRAQLSALVSELATLPHTFDNLHSSTRNTLLVSVRQSIRSHSLPASARTLVLRTASRLLGPSSPPENASWTALPLWDEATLTTLFALLVDALDESGYDAQEKKLSKLPVTEKQGGENLSDFGKLMLTPQEQAALAEETSESDEDDLLPLAVSIIPNPPDIPFALQSAITASQPAQLAAAHVSHALATTGRYDRAPAVRRAAFLALATLARAMPPDLLAAFLPGLASTLARGLQNTTLEQAPVVMAALDAFAAVVFSAFPPGEFWGTEADGLATSFAEALEQRRSRSAVTANASTASAQNGSQEPASKPDPVTPRGLLILRNDSWSPAASKEVSLRICLFLESRSGPSSHSSVRARLAVVRFARVALLDTSTLALDEHVRCLLKFALVEMAGDGYPVIRNEALRALKRLVKVGKVKVREIESGLKALIKAVGRRDEIVEVGGVDREEGLSEKSEDSGSVQSGLSRDVDDDVIRKLMDVKDEEFWVRLCDGYLRVLVPSQDEESRQRLSILTSDKLATSLVRVGVDQFCRMLMSMLEGVWIPNADSEDKRFAELDNRVLKISFRIGQVGLLSSLYTTLFSHGSCTTDEELDKDGEVKAADDLHLLSSFRSRAHAILILQAAVRGAIARDQCSEDDMQVHIKHVLQYGKDLLSAMTSFLLPTMEDSISDGAGLVDDTMISLKRCLLHCTSELIHELSSAHERTFGRPVSSDVILLVLMSLLKDVSHGEKAIRKTAQDTLQSMARTTRCTDVRQLIARHLNYLISRLARHLEERWAGDVLSFIIGTKGDEVSEEATILLEATLRDLNNSLAGAGDARALKALGAIESVLVTAVRQSRNGVLPDDDNLQLDRSSLSGTDVTSEANIATLHQKLFFYCTEDIIDYGELTAAKDAATTHCQDTDENENQVQSAFEKVALNTLDGMRDLLVGRPWNVRAAALSCATWAVYLLKDNQTDLLPHAANILPLLPDQFVVVQQRLSKGERMLERIHEKKFRGHQDAVDVEHLVKHLNGKGAELPVVTNACRLLSALAQCAGSFIRNRFVTLIYPKMRPLLRLASCFPTLLAGSTVKSNDRITSPPSYGSMSASDACLEAVASMASVLPESLAPHSFSIVKYLAVYFDSQHDPQFRGQRNVGHLNRSLLRYEKERWQKRARWAESIVRNLRTVNPGDVVTSLLCYDKSAPEHVECRDASLYNVTIRTRQSVVR